jgi:hypothetical protein
MLNGRPDLKITLVAHRLDRKAAANRKPKIADPCQKGSGICCKTMPTIMFLRLGDTLISECAKLIVKSPAIHSSVLNRIQI